MLSNIYTGFSVSPLLCYGGKWWSLIVFSYNIHLLHKLFFYRDDLKILHDQPTYMILFYQHVERLGMTRRNTVYSTDTVGSTSWYAFQGSEYSTETVYHGKRAHEFHPVWESREKSTYQHPPVARVIPASRLGMKNHEFSSEHFLIIEICEQ